MVKHLPNSNFKLYTGLNYLIRSKGKMVMALVGYSIKWGRGEKLFGAQPPQQQQE